MSLSGKDTVIKTKRALIVKSSALLLSRYLEISLFSVRHD